MNYKKIHDDIIKRGTSRPISDIIKYETHHIVPRSFGGTNDKLNLVKLTLREHFIIHKLLVKLNDGYKRYQMLCALFRFVSVENTKMTSHDYEYIRTKYGQEHSKRMAGKTHSTETKLNMSTAQKLRYKNTPSHWLGRKHNEGTKSKMSDSQRGENNPQYGLSRSEETKSKISASLKGIKKSQETVDKFKSRTQNETSKSKISESLKLYHEKKRNAKISEVG